MNTINSEVGQTEHVWKPTRAQLLEAEGKTVADVIAKNLDVLFCGINPGLYTAAVGHHFARPGNRFWSTLHKAGFTPRLFSPFEEELLLEHKIGITNIVNKATAQAADLTIRELEDGKKTLEKKIVHYSPHTLAVLGLGAYRIAFNHPKAEIGLQKEMIESSYIWVLPNPSGLNASYQIDKLVSLFNQLYQWIGKEKK
ncbi:MAG TPA: G/U mismatch-specific DNA glycosylase [Chitinispirillaceae bacterium]|nr:G/U mismatch-specific DNA glycosylase [Chitinispirillaceae bacterium]